VRAINPTSTLDSLSENWFRRSESLSTVFSSPVANLLTTAQRKHVLNTFMQSKGSNVDEASAAGARGGIILGESLASNRADERSALLELTTLISTWVEHLDRTHAAVVQRQHTGISPAPEALWVDTNHVVIDALCTGCINAATQASDKFRPDSKAAAPIKAASLPARKKTPEQNKRNQFGVTEQQDDSSINDVDSALRHDIKSPLQGALLTTELLILESLENKIDVTELKAILHSIKDAINLLNTTKPH